MARPRSLRDSERLYPIIFDRYCKEQSGPFCDLAKVGKATLDNHLVSVLWIEGKVGITVPNPGHTEGDPATVVVPKSWMEYGEGGRLEQ